MLTISKEALAVIEARNHPLYLDAPRVVRGCCFGLSVCPSVRFGTPPNAAEFTGTTIQGVTIYLPACFPDIPLEIRVMRFLGFQWLTLSGWRLA